MSTPTRKADASSSNLTPADVTAWRATLQVGSGSGAIPTGNLVWVDAVNGDDATGERGRQDLPFATIAAAITASVSGDAVSVLPGNYPEFELSPKDGTALVMDAGASVGGVDDVGRSFVIGDGGVAKSFSVIGGEISHHIPDDSIETAARGLVVSHAGSEVFASVVSIEVSHWESFDFAAVAEAGSLTLEADRLIAQGNYAIFVQQGSAVVRARLITGGLDKAFYLNGTGSLDVAASLISSAGTGPENNGGTLIISGGRIETPDICLSHSGGSTTVAGCVLRCTSNSQVLAAQSSGLRVIGCRLETGASTVSAYNGSILLVGCTGNKPLGGTVTNTGTPYFVDGDTAGGDVVGPASAISGGVALFSGTTGKIIADGGTLGTAAFTSTSAFATAAQGALADSATQPGDAATTLAMATARLLGRSTAGAGAVEEITIGSNLTLSGGTLSATGGGGSGDVVGPASAVSGNVSLFDGTTGKLIKDGGTLGSAAFTTTSAFATAAQGALADSATQPGDAATTLNMATARLLGRSTAGAGAVEELVVGSGLSLSAGTLSATGGGTGDVVGPASAVSGGVALYDGTTGKLIKDGGVLGTAAFTTVASLQPTITGAATTITDANLTASRAVVSNASGKVAVSAVTDTELGYLSGTTSAVQTQLNAKAALITGGASSITLTNLTASRALVSDGSGKVAASSVTDTELGYVSGVTSALQTQLNAKQPTITGGASSITLTNLTASRALVSDGSGKVAVATVTATELGYVSGVTSAIQTQFTGKANTGAITATGITMNTARLLGRTTAAAGAVEEISVGAGLSLSAGELTATGGGGGGKVLQIVQATELGTQSVAGTTYASVLSASITPSSASSRVLVLYNVSVGNPTSSAAAFKLQRGGSDILIADAAGSRQRVTQYVYSTNAAVYQFASMSYLDSPSTTSATTYSVAMAAAIAGNTVYIGRSHADSDSSSVGRCVSTILLLEIAA